MRKKHCLTKKDYALSNRAFMEQYGVNRQSVWRAKKQGFVFVGYHEKQYSPDIEHLTDNDIEVINIVSGVVASRFAKNYNCPSIKEDLKQEVTLRLLELSGDLNFSSLPWKYRVAKNTCLDYLAKQKGSTINLDESQFSTTNSGNPLLWAEIEETLTASEASELKRFLKAESLVLSTKLKKKIKAIIF